MHTPHCFGTIKQNSRNIWTNFMKRTKKKLEIDGQTTTTTSTINQSHQSQIATAANSTLQLMNSYYTLVNLDEMKRILKQEDGKTQHIHIHITHPDNRK